MNGEIFILIQAILKYQKGKIESRHEIDHSEVLQEIYIWYY